MQLFLENTNFALKKFLNFMLKFKHEPCRKRLKDFVLTKFIFITELNKPLDIAFAVDSSTGIQTNNWNQILLFIKGIISKFQIAQWQYSARFGFITFSERAAIYKTFNAFQGAELNQASVFRAVDGLPRQDGEELRIDQAFNVAGSGMFTQAAGIRPWALKVWHIVCINKTFSGFVQGMEFLESHLFLECHLFLESCLFLEYEQINR